MKTAETEPQSLPAILIDPAEFGLDEQKGKEVAEVFLPIITERDLLAENYAVITSQEITPKTTQQARDLRLKLVKLRTNTDRIHKAAKAFYLAGGRFVDAWKNKNVVVIEQMEEKLEDIELHFVRIEMERIEKLSQERQELLSAFTTEFPEGLGTMPKEVFDAYLTGLAVKQAEKLQEEKRLEDERIEQERILNLHKARKESILKLWQYVDPEIEYSNFGAMSDEKWTDTCAVLNGRKKKQDDENERIRLDNEAKRIENEKLQKEAQQQLAKAEEERKKAAEERQKIEDDARTERLKAEVERQKLQAEIQAQKDAEAALLREKEKAEQDRLAQEEAAKKAPKKEKLTKWVSFMTVVAPSGMEQDEMVMNISAKFEAFKIWATKEIEKL